MKTIKPVSKTRDRYMTMAMQVSEMSYNLGIRRNLDFLLNEAALRLVNMKLTKKELSWIRQTQGDSKTILKAIADQKRLYGI
jgi:hypothetical protein